MKYLIFTLPFLVLANAFAPKASVNGGPRQAPAQDTLHHYLGHVTDTYGNPLMYVRIQTPDATLLTLTDLDGNFRFTSPDACTTLRFSFPGYEERTDKVCHQHAAAVVLKAIPAPRPSERENRGYAAESAAPTMMMDAVRSAAPTPKHSAERTRDYAAKASAAPAAPTTRASTPGKPGGVAPPADQPLPRAGQLTAGEVNDFTKWDFWADVSREDLGQYRKTWQQYADHRYTLQLTSPLGQPVVNAAVALRDGQGNVLWKARTDVHGRAELWANYFLEAATPDGGLSISGSHGALTFNIAAAKPFAQGINFYTLEAPCRDQPMIDVAFVVDATGSMGDEISYLQAELLDVVRRVQDSLPAADLQLGSVFYRDQTDAYLTRTQPLTPRFDEVLAFIKAQSAGGGGDYPEAVDDALVAAIDSLQWRTTASTRLLFLVLDAPPHQAESQIKRLQVAITKAAAQGIQIIPVGCSGIDKSTEYLMRTMALATGGTYTFVTDHSGIGDAHIEPSTDAYTVEMLNDVIVRLAIARSRLSPCATPIANTTTPPNPKADTARGWTFYPNPTRGQVAFTFTEPALQGSLYLADAQGKLLQRFTPNAALSIDLSGYPAGSYWLRHDDTLGKVTQGRVLLVR